MQHETDLERRALSLKQQANASEKTLTFHTLSQLIAKCMLLLALAIWLRAYMVYVSPRFLDPQNTLTIESVLGGLLDMAIVIGFAAGHAVLPPLLLSVLVSASPGQIVLTHIQRKVGMGWLLFAVGVGAYFTYESVEILYTYWASRPIFHQEPAVDPRLALTFTIGSTLLLIGFPAWALNRLTPQQWVDSMIMAREALRIKHIIDLEDATGKALIARVRGLLLIDTMELTLEERAANNAEVAGILAGAARGFKRALIQVGESYKALGGYEMNLRLEQDDAINQRFGQIGRLLTATTDQFDHTESFAHGLAEPEIVRMRDLPPDQQRAAIAESFDRALENRSQSSANARERSTVDHRGPVNGSADGWPHAEALREVYAKFGFEPWKRSDVQALLKIEKTQASAFIADWKQSGAVRELTEPKWTYVVVEGGRA